MTQNITTQCMRVVAGALALLCSLHAPAQTSNGADATPAQWGAIASKQGWFGYTFNQASRADAERSARAQCDRAAGRAAPCEVRMTFNQTCGALATGNYGEWGTATGVTTAAAGRAATTECGRHLPTEPCKVVVSVCSSAPTQGG